MYLVSLILISLWSSILCFKFNTPNSHILSTKLMNIFHEYNDGNLQAINLFLIRSLDTEYLSTLFKYNVHTYTQTSVVILNIMQGCLYNYLEEETNILGHFNLMFLFMDTSADSLNYTFSCLEKMSLWKPRTRMVVVLSEYAQRDIIEDMLRLAWSRKILNLVVVVIIDDKAEVIGFNPFFENYFQNLTDKDIFYNKLRDFNGYVLNILLTRDEDVTKVVVKTVGNVTSYGGKDGALMMSILEHVNANYKIINLSKLFKSDNPWRPMNKGRGLGGMKIVIIQKYDADFIMDAQELVKNNATEYLYPHARDDIVFFVPKAKLRSQYSQLLTFFKDGFAIIILFFTVACPVCWYFIYCCEIKIRLKKDVKNEVYSPTLFILNNFRMVLGLSAYCTPKYCVEKLFILWLLVCNLVINAYFQSVLASILTISHHEPELNSIRDVIDSGKRPFALKGIVEEAAKVLEATGQTELIARFAPVPESFLFIEYQKVPPGLYGTINFDRGEYGIVIQPFYHMVAESLIPCFQAFQTVRGSPYYDMLNTYILRIMETGLHDMWKRKTLHEYVLSIGGPMSRQSNEFQHLTLYQLQGALFLLLLGLGISFCIFLIEHFFFILKAKWLENILNT